MIEDPTPVSARGASRLADGDDWQETRASRHRRALPALTRDGFAQVRMPEGLFTSLRSWLHRTEAGEAEQGAEAVVRSDRGGTPSELVSLEAAPDLEAAALEEVQGLLEAWSGEPLVPSQIYGIRVYRRGALLYRHADRVETHVLSAVLCIESDVEVPWPLVLEDPAGCRHEVSLEPGDALLYEGARLPHYRDTPLVGRSYAAAFVHFRPRWWAWTDERVIEADALAPPQRIEYGSDVAVPSPAAPAGHLAFQRDHGGLNNVLMQLEILVGLAWLTGRTLVLPPASPLYLLGDDARGLESWIDVERLSRFVPTITAEAFAAEQGVGPFEGLDAYAAWMDENAHPPRWNALEDVLVHPPDADPESGSRRPVTLASVEDADVLYFPMTEAHRMFGPFEPFFALADDGLRRRLRRVVRDAIRYRPDALRRAERALHDPALGRGFGAMHVRRGDFGHQYGPTQIPAEALLESARAVIPPGRTIYLATDESDPSFFDPLRAVYRVVTFPHLEVADDTPPEETGIVETLICAGAPGPFVGTRLSTFSTRIQTLRGHLRAGGHEAIDAGIHHTQPWWESGEPPDWARVRPETWLDADEPKGHADGR